MFNNDNGVEGNTVWVIAGNTAYYDVIGAFNNMTQIEWAQHVNYEVNDIVYICDYLPDGLTNQGSSLFDKNPKGYGLYLYQSSLYGKINGLEKWNLFAEFLYKNRETFSFFEICRILHLNPVNFILRILGLRLFYRIYR